MAAMPPLHPAGVAIPTPFLIGGLLLAIVLRSALPAAWRNIARGRLEREAAELSPSALSRALHPPWWIEMFCSSLDALVAIIGVLAVATTHQWETFVRQKVQTSALEFIADPDRAFSDVPPEWRLDFRHAGVISAAKTGRQAETAAYLDSLLSVAADSFEGPVRSRVELTYAYDRVADASGRIGLNVETKTTLPCQPGMKFSVTMPLVFGSYDPEVTASRDPVWAKVEGENANLPVRFVRRDTVGPGVPQGRSYYLDRYETSVVVQGLSKTVFLHSRMLVDVNEPLCWGAIAPTGHVEVNVSAPHRSDAPRLLSFRMRRPESAGIEQQWERVNSSGSLVYSWSSEGWRAPGEGFAIIWSNHHASGASQERRNLQRR